MLKIIAYLGNTELLKLPKTAFLCSRQVPAGVVLKCYDWAIAQRDAGRCIISGFHSQLEKDVMHYLLKGNQPIILVPARGLKKRLEPELKDAINEKRLLIVTPFDEKIKRVARETASQRNRFMAELADEIFVVYALPGGNIEKLITDISHTGKTISSFKTG